MVRLLFAHAPNPDLVRSVPAYPRPHRGEARRRVANQATEPSESRRSSPPLPPATARHTGAWRLGVAPAMRVLPLALAAALFFGVTAILIYLSGLSSYGGARLSEADLFALTALQGGFGKCMDANGLGLKAVSGKDYCQVVIQYPSNTVSKWTDPNTGEAEGLSFEFNLCEAVASWEQVRNSTTVLTKEYIDALPNGWEEYAWRRINKGILLTDPPPILADIAVPSSSGKGFLCDTSNPIRPNTRKFGVDA